MNYSPKKTAIESEATTYSTLFPSQVRSEKPVITHIITGLNTGGAEMMLYKLLLGMNRDRFDVRVISLRDGGAVRKKIEALNIPVSSLGMTKNFTILSGAIRLGKQLRQYRPDLIQTWMYHADLIGGLIGKLVTKAPIVWNIQASDIANHPDNRTTPLTIKSCAFLSTFVPNKIISCSEIGHRVHVSLGYAADKLLTIPNGVKLSGLWADETARMRLRQELKLEGFTPLIGLIARFHPQKDHRNFIQAAAQITQVRPDIHFVLCGDDVTWDNPTLGEWIDGAGLHENFHLLGRRDDISHINAALDIATLSSAYAEGFPNVLGEAMSCEVPCVVTDVGDSAMIVGETGIVVPPRDSAALAQAWLTILQMSLRQRKDLGRAARRRVEEKFGLPFVIEQYENLYNTLLSANSSFRLADTTN